MLCERLTEELSTLSVHLIRKEREELRKQRLKFVDISVSNILKKQNTKTNRRKGSVTKENGSEAGDELLAEGFDENEQQLNDENEENIEEKQKNRPKKRRKRVTIEGDEGEDGKEDNEEVSDDESGADDDIGRAVWSDDEEEDDEEEEEEDKFVAIKSRRNRSRKNINYKFSEFDELIKSAIEQDVEYEYDVSAEDPSAPKLESKGKDMSNIIASNTEELDFSLTPAPKPEDQVISDQKLPEIDVQTDDNQNKIEIKSISEEKPAEEPLENKMDVEEKAKEQEEGGEEEEEDEEDSDENESKSTTNKKRHRRSSTSARKRHRGLNDLSDTEEEDDDSDEDFKGDDSATEVEEGSDDEFVDDGSTQEDEEVSDESDFKYSRRRSGRNASKASKGGKRRSKGGAKNNARKGYRRDAFVVSSEDSDDYKPGRSSKAKKTRAAARKRISYREETTTEEESEEEYYWNSNKNKSKNKSRKGRAGSESSSEEEWGGRKAAKSKKSKNSSEDDEEEEDEEEDDDNDDNNDDKEESEKSDKEVVGSKPGPKSSKPTPPRPLSMKGKPRLSKAKGLLKLKEVSDEEDSELKTHKSKKNKVLSDSEEEEELKDNKSGDNLKTGAQSVDTISGNNKQSVNQLNDQNFDTKSKPIESLEKMVTNSGLNSSELTLKKTTIDNNQLLNSSEPISVHKTTVPHLLAQQLNNYPSAAMKTTLPSDINSIKQNISHNSRDISFDKNSNQLPNNQNNNNTLLLILLQ